MKTVSLGIAAALTFGFAPTAWADNVAHCEVLLMKIIADENGGGEAQIASYRPAVNFLASLYDEDTESHMTEVDNFPIRAVLCRRNNVIPAPTDYNIMATGIPFILSQDFDSTETDSLTVYWKDDADAFDYVYKGNPLSDEAQESLDTRLTEFSKRGLLEKAVEEEATDGTSDDVTDLKIESEIEANLTPETENDE